MDNRRSSAGPRAPAFRNPLALAAALLLAALAAPALAQTTQTQGGPARAPQPQAAMPDPFRGQFGVIEAALPPAEALRQAELMGAALAGLAPQRPGVADVYIVAASLWGEPVFEREAMKGAEALARHFGAAGRTAVLSAGTGRGERALPAATPNNLHAVLAKVGRLIDPAEDLVVVFFTSHGGQDGALALQEVNRLGGALRPFHLARALTEAGVRNRLLIVSACHSGAFIAPFSDDGSIVLTAAAADRTSFGCEPNREWTWFGDAFFARSLGKGGAGGGGVLAAYDRALGLIAGWEKEQALTPSNPQKHVGEAAAALLARVEAAAGVSARP